VRAITVRQPWAWAIVHGGKDVENRTRNIAGAYRGPIAIHAGLAAFEQNNAASRAHRVAHGTETDARLVFGAIVGVVDLRATHHWTFCEDEPEGACSSWAMDGCHHLELANPRPLAKPIPWRGQLGLWTLPDDVLGGVA
jgi:hypothetical protein